MNIALKKQKLSFRCKYVVNAPDSNYYAEKSLLPFGGFRLLSGDREKTLVRIRSRPSFFRAKHEFQLPHGPVYRFRRETFWTGVFVCDGGQEPYRLYTHKGLRYSLFRGDWQVAAFVKHRIVILNGDRYEIRVNGDEDALLVICIAIIIDALEGAHSETVTVELGNVRPEAKQFDE